MNAWLHIRTAALTPEVIVTFDTKHKQGAPGALLSITRNVAGTEAIVKVSGGEKTWSDALPVGTKAEIVRIYTEKDHGEVFGWFYGTDWQLAEEEEDK